MFFQKIMISHKFKWLLCTKKPVLNRSLQDFRGSNLNDYQILLKKVINKFIKAKISTPKIQILNLNYEKPVLNVCLNIFYEYLPVEWLLCVGVRSEYGFYGIFRKITMTGVDLW